MENTYGYLAINRWTFNQDPRYPEKISKETFKNIHVALTINNCIFNFFGYLNCTRWLSGQLRILTSTIVLIGCSTWVLSSLKNGENVNRFAVEGILTAITQIFRGYLEAFLVYGKLINLALDLVCSPLNIEHNSKPVILPREGELMPYLPSEFREVEGYL